MDLLKKAHKHFPGQDFLPFKEVGGGLEVDQEEHVQDGENPVAIPSLAIEVSEGHEDTPLFSKEGRELSGLQEVLQGFESEATLLADSSTSDPHKE